MCLKIFHPVWQPRKYCHDKSPGWEMAQQNPRSNQENEAVSAVSWQHSGMSQARSRAFAHTFRLHYLHIHIFKHIIYVHRCLSLSLCDSLHISCTYYTSHIGGVLNLGYPQIIQVIRPWLSIVTHPLSDPQRVAIRQSCIRGANGAGLETRDSRLSWRK